MSVNYLLHLPNEAQIGIRYFPEKDAFYIGGRCEQIDICYEILTQYLGVQKEDIRFRQAGSRIKSNLLHIEKSIMFECIKLLQNSVVVQKIKKFDRFFS